MQSLSQFDTHRLFHTSYFPAPKQPFSLACTSAACTCRIIRICPSLSAPLLYPAGGEHACTLTRPHARRQAQKTLLHRDPWFTRIALLPQPAAGPSEVCIPKRFRDKGWEMSSALCRFVLGRRTGLPVCRAVQGNSHSGLGPKRQCSH